MRFFKFVLVFLAILTPTLSAYGQVTVETFTSSFSGSGGLAIDDTGIVYVADFGQAINNGNGTTVVRILGDGSIQPFASGMFGVSGNAFDSQGNLIQSEIGRNQLLKIAPDGSVSVFATSEILGPIGVAVASGDTVFVTSCAGDIVRVNPDGSTSIWVSSGLFACPNGLTIDDAGNLYASNFNDGGVIKITPDKQVSLLTTLPGGSCGKLTFFEGTLYATTRCANTIHSITLAGISTLIAGSGLRGNVDGPGLSATFNEPNGIEARREGINTVLYVTSATSLFGNCFTMPLNPVLVRKIIISPENAQSLADADLSIVTTSPVEIQANGIDSAVITITPLNNRAVAPIDGVTAVTLANSGGGQLTTAIDNGDGTFNATIVAPSTQGADTIIVSVEAGGVVTELATRPTLVYWACGDIDGSLTEPDIGDLTFLIDVLFINFPSPPIPASANIDCAGTIDIADLTVMIDHLFINFPPLCCN